MQDKVNEIRLFEGRVGYVKSADNPADIASRGMPLRKLITETFWWKGPKWASEKILSEQTYHVDQETQNEIGKEVVLHEIGLVTEPSYKLNPPFGISIDSFSSYHRLIRVTGWCLRFMDNYFTPNQDGLKCGYLQCGEIQNSVILWDKFVQTENFGASRIEF